MAAHSLSSLSLGGPRPRLSLGGPRPPQTPRLSSAALGPRRGAALLAVVGVWLAPAAAMACPYCATGSGWSTGMRVALGAFLALPFAVAGVVYTVLRVHGQQ
jgi:hypothetical protein